MNIFENVQFIGYDETLTEGAKIDLLLKNFLKEGKDYKGLKADLDTIIQANNIKIKKNNCKALMKICKRIIQTSCDILSLSGLPLVAVADVLLCVALTKEYGPLGITASQLLFIILKQIICFIIFFITTRLIRYAVDYNEFEDIESEAYECVDILRKTAKNSKNDKTSEKLNSEADKLEQTINEYKK